MTDTGNDALRAAFEKAYPPPTWANENDAQRWIHYNALKKEWEGFQKGYAWGAADARAEENELCGRRRGAGDEA